MASLTTLYLMLVVMVSPQGQLATSQLGPFSDRATCETAGRTVKSAFEPRGLQIDAVCVASGTR